MKEKTLDKDTIVAYHSFVQQRIKNELNGLSMGPAWLPCRMALLLAIFSIISNTIGFLLIGLRSRHVYLVDWWAQFTGPFFVIIGLIAASGAVYLVIIAKRKSNKYRSELFFRPIGDFGVAVVHKSNLQFEQETKPELKSGTNPNRAVLPNPERKHRDGHDNRAYDRRDDRRDRQHDRERHGGRDNRDDHRGRRDERKRDPQEEERRRRERKEREARGEIDPREKEYRERRAREMRERDNRDRDGRPPRPNTEKPHREREPRDEGQQQGGRNTGRGAPRIPVDASGFVPPDRIILDADFGRPAETSSRASESEL